MQTVIKFNLEKFRTKKRVKRVLSKELISQFREKSIESLNCTDYDKRSKLVKELEHLRDLRGPLLVSWNLYDTHRDYDRHQNGMSIKF